MSRVEQEQPGADMQETYPDVWWGENGIDALLWADPPPYIAPTLEPPAASIKRPPRSKTLPTDYKAAISRTSVAPSMTANMRTRPRS